MKRKILIMFIVLFAFSTNVKAYELTVSNKQLSESKISSELMEFLDLSEENLTNMSEAEINYIKNIDLTNSKKEIFYFEDTYIYLNIDAYSNKSYPISIKSKKITKSEYEMSSQQKGLVYNNKSILKAASSANYYETNAKKITLIISQLSTNVKEKYVTSTLTWKTISSVRSYDVYGMRINNGYFIKDSQSGLYYAEGSTMDNACTGLNIFKESSSITTGWNRANINTLLHGVSYTGIGYTVKLRANSLKCFNDFGIPMYDNVTAMNSRIASNAYSTSSTNTITVYSSYQHATSTVSYNNVVSNYTFVSGGLGNVINFTNGYNSYYDGMGGVSLTN